jgi:hypothetical protein
MARFYTEGKFVAKDMEEANRWVKLAEENKSRATSEDVKQITNEVLSTSNGGRRRRLEEKRSLRVRDQRRVGLSGQ